MSVTEYTGLTLKPGFEKEALAKGGVIAKSVDAILTQTGATVAHYATAVEKPQQLWTFVERESSDRETR